MEQLILSYSKMSIIILLIQQWSSIQSLFTPNKSSLYTISSASNKSLQSAVTLLPIQIPLYRGISVNKHSQVAKLSLLTFLSNVGFEQHCSTLPLSSFVRDSKMDIKLFIPIKYPSSWLPTFQAELWSMLMSSGTGTVFAKSIIQIDAFLLSCTKSRELPINSCVRKKWDSFNVDRMFFNLSKYFGCNEK